MRKYLLPANYVVELTSSVRWAALDITTPEVKANLDDLKVLGKGDFKALLKWRTALREEVYILSYISL